MRQELRELTMFLVLGLPFGVAAAGLGGYALARGALAPVTRMAVRAQSITAARLNDRLPVDHPHDELGRLAVVFNETLERLEQSFEQMQRFTGRRVARAPDAADGDPHGRRGRACASRAARTRTARTIGSMLEEVDRLTSLVERLLTLSRAASGPAHLQTNASISASWPTRSPAYLGVLAEENGQSIAVRAVGSRRRATSTGWCCARRWSISSTTRSSTAPPTAKSRSARSPPTPRSSSKSATPARESRRSAARGSSIAHYRAEAGGRGAGLGLAIAKWAVEVNRGQLTWQPCDWRRQHLPHDPAARDHRRCHSRGVTL